MRGEWPDPEALLDRMVEDIEDEFDRLDRRGEFDGFAAFMDRWEDGKIGPEARRAVEQTSYRFADRRAHGKTAQAWDGTGDGTSVGLFLPLPEELAREYPSLGDEDPSPPHVTLLFIGNVPEARQEALLTVLRNTLATEPAPIQAWTNGVDHFTHPDKNREVFYTPIRFSRDVGEIRDHLRSELIDAGFEVAHSFPLAFFPHTTLAYSDGTDNVYHGDPPNGAWEFNTVQVWGLPDQVHTLPFGSFGPLGTSVPGDVLYEAWGEMLGD